MKNIYAIIILVLFVGMLAHAEIKVVSVKGDINVRHGAKEEWFAVKAGDILKPEDSMRSGKDASATLLVDEITKLSVPGNVIIDLSDIRTLTQEELLLKLAMEGIRSAPAHKKDNEFTIPKTTTVHGTDNTQKNLSPAMRAESYTLLLNGTKVLYRHGFYATSVLRAKEVLRLDPVLQKRIDIRLMVADALEKVDLNAEALSEYISVSKEKLSADDRAIVKGKIAQLKKIKKG